MEDKKVFYAITEGDYSDYHIITITDNKESAEHYAKIFKANIEPFADCGIEESELYYEVEIDKNSNSIIDISCYELSGYQYGEYSSKLGNLRTIQYLNRNSCVFRFFAKDREHAKKIALDKYYERKAKQEGVM